MSDAHIEAIRTALEGNHWVILKVRLVDEYDTTAYWDIARPNGTNQLTIAFEGGYHHDGLQKRTFEESIGCVVLEHINVEIYFSRINRSWQSEFPEFIRELNYLG